MLSRRFHLLCLLLPALSRADAPKVDFQRDIQPILKSACYECHGPEKQKGGLRLDSKELTFKGGKTSKAVIPGDAKSSYLVQRMKGEGDEERMPVKKDPLTPQQIALFESWINQGADWPDHASIRDATIKKHWAYVKPVRPDLPPVNSPWGGNPVDAFVAARLDRENLRPSPEASRETLLRRVYIDLTGLPPSPKEVDEFLADRDSHAYEKVVDRLLGSPHYGERWARVWLDLARYADTNGYEADARRSIWPWRDWVINALNRDLPFDRFTIEQIAGDLLPNPTQDFRVATGFHRNTMANLEGGVDQSEARWLVDVDRVNTTAAVWLGSTVACAQCHNHKFDPISQKEFYGLMAFFENASETQIKVFTPEQESKYKALEQQIAETDASLQKRKTELAPALEAWDAQNTKRVTTTQPATKTSTQPATLPAFPKEVLTALRVEPAKRDDTHRRTLKDYFRTQDPQFKEIAAKLDKLKKDLAAFPVPTTLVMQEKESKETAKSFIRVRGNYLNKAEAVPAGVPAVLNPFPADAHPTRLGLAQWLVSKDNPLTARVHVNRLWEQLFGRGLVDTPEDFGLQGSHPTHPELLDWLATEFMNQNWSQKAILRTIVTSATYRQSVRVSRSLLEKDPYNKLLARGPRFRMEAEMVRDVVLASSGQLNSRLNGPPVMPPQPEGIWDLPYNNDKWKTAGDDNRFHRAIYTFWRRTAPYPTFMALDAPSREFCTVSRVRTNTPLQALALLNDEAFFDAARAMAQRVLKEAKADTESRATYAFKLAASRAPSPRELAHLLELYTHQLQAFEKDPAAAKTLLTGHTKPMADVPFQEAAAWTLVCNVVLNMDETLTKQ